MAKYTNDDTDIKYLAPQDRVAFNYVMLNYNVDEYQEIRKGANSITILTNPEQLANMFKSPKQFLDAILVILIFTIMILLMICTIIIIVLYVKGGSENQIRINMLNTLYAYFIVVLLLLLIMYFFFNKINQKSVEASHKLKPPKTNTHKINNKERRPEHDNPNKVYNNISTVDRRDRSPENYRNSRR